MSYCFNLGCGSPQNGSQAQTCQSCEMPLLLKSRYRGLKLMGQGSFGRTLMAIDDTLPLKPRCVVKQFFPRQQGMGSTEKAAAHFRQEAARLAQLGGHPQIPTLLAYVEQDSYQYVVQEYIEGLNLAQELHTQGPFSEKQLRKLLQEMLAVLDFMHERQVIHRDIKPENIIARPAALFVLVDFGAAKVLTGDALSKTGTLIGSASYAAPEQAAGKAIFASDLYSLGVTCLHLLTQMLPFDLFDLSEGAWAWKDYVTQPISRELTQILDRMVEPATRRRYGSASDVLEDLKTSPITPSPRSSAQKPGSRSPFQPESPPVPSNSPRSTPSHLLPIQDASQPRKPSVKWGCWRSLEGHSKAVHAVAWSPNSQQVASASEDGTVKLWNPVSGQLLRTLGNGSLGAYDAVAFSHDGQIVAGAGYDGMIRLWRTSTGTLSSTLKGHSRYVSHLAFSPDGQWLASTSYDNTLRLWKLTFSQRLFLWQVVKAQAAHVLTNIHGGWVCGVAFSPDSRQVATVGEDGSVQVWRVDQGRLLKTLKGHEGTTQAVVFSPNGQWIASSGKDNTIRIWQVSTGTLRHTVLLKSEATTLSFCSGEQILVSGQTDCNLYLWQVSDGKKLGVLTGHSKLVNSLGSSQNGQYLVSGSEDKTLKIWSQQPLG
jgi:WD40 repeat protein